jgi:hypothetical protein
VNKTQVEDGAGGRSGACTAGKPRSGVRRVMQEGDCGVDYGRFFSPFLHFPDIL